MEPFRPNRGPLKLSANMVIENLARVLDINPEAVASIADFEEQQPGGGAAEPSQSGWRMWSEEEAQAAAGGACACQPADAGRGQTCAAWQECIACTHPAGNLLPLCTTCVLTCGSILQLHTCPETLMPFCGTDEEAGDEEERWADKFAAFVTSTYAGLQSRAAEKCGVLPGEAWRAAMEAAAMAGARQVRGSCRPAPCMLPSCS